LVIFIKTSSQSALQCRISMIWKFLAAKVESIVGTEFMFPKCNSKCTSWSATMRGFSTKGVWSNSQTEPKFELWIAHTMLRIVICDDLEW